LKNFSFSFNFNLLFFFRSKVAKVDTHIHLAAAFTSTHLFKFIQHKLKEEPSTIVAKRDGKDVTLSELFVACNIDPLNISISSLDTQADNLSTFNRFDNFNSLYNPFGDASLRAVFMKTDSFNQGQVIVCFCFYLLKFYCGVLSQID
jgi:AMP deaminase